jgi:hypothetical protein
LIINKKGVKMKQEKIILIVLLLLGFSSVVFAQGITAKGVKGGLNIATLTGYELGGEKYKIGFVFGGFLTYELNQKFSLQPELLFTMKGAKSEYVDKETEDDGSQYYSKFKVSWNLNYLEIPFLSKLNIPLKENIKSNIFCGPALGIKIGATYDADYEYWEKDENGDIVEEVNESDDGDIKDIKSMDFGIIFGAGVEFGKIIVDARYNLGLSTISKEKGGSKIKNSVISLILGIKL